MTYKFNQTEVLDYLGLERPNSTHLPISLNRDEFLGLYRESLLDPTEKQNDAPSIQDFVSFAVSHRFPEDALTFEGYIILDREDARLSIDTIILDPTYAQENLKLAFIDNFRDADEFYITGGQFRAWWD